MLNGKSVLITGGTGSFGQAFVETVFDRFPDIKRLVVFSRDELKQSEMALRFSAQQYKNIRFFLGDVRDERRMKRALERIDYVVHAAALKQVMAAEYNPIEFINTNVLGTQNVINACIESNVTKVVSLSTDKAAAPINLYGATKLCADKLMVAANNITSRDICFSVVRYGNVMGSRGSVVPLFLKLRDSKKLPITDPGMTRFSLTLEESIDLVLHALSSARGGELFVPKIPSYRIMDLAKAIAPDAEHEIVGIRPGEKIHEVMITADDARMTWDHESYFTVLPDRLHWSLEQWLDETGAKKVDEGFEYSSGSNSQFLSIQDIQNLINKHIESG